MYELYVSMNRQTPCPHLLDEARTVIFDWSLEVEPSPKDISSSFCVAYIQLHTHR